jgi:lysozyme family protein
VADTFPGALAFVLAREGGYVNDPRDPGGATNQGITQATYDRWRRAHQQPERPVGGIAEDEVRAIYEAEYWRAGHCPDLPWPLQLVHFDASVNHGVEQAAKFLQRAVGVTADGQIGPQTMAAVAALSPGDATRCAEDYLWLRAAFYRSLAQRREASVGFLPGWIRRLELARAAMYGRAA